MKAVISFSVAALAAFAVLAGCHRGQLAVADHPRGFPGVASEDVTFYSSALDRNMTYAVHMPKDSAGGKRFPVVYLLHGCGGRFRDWISDSDVGAYGVKGLILVTVDGDCSYYMNSALDKESLRWSSTVDPALPPRQSRCSSTRVVGLRLFLCQPVAPGNFLNSLYS
jgi:hypothetical protein